MLAADKFTIGQRVRLSAEGIKSGLAGKANRTTGVVKGFPSKPEAHYDVRVLVRIHRDGVRQSGIYHMDFWEPAND